MSIFDIRQSVIDEYSKYVQSFFSISDKRIRDFIEESLIRNCALWPDALLQLNPSYEMADAVAHLATEKKLHPLCGDIFCAEDGSSIRLFRHQQEAIERALNRKHFVVTSGTGSGKTLAYFIPFFDAILRNKPLEPKVKAIVVYPMNALVNSQKEALKRLSDQYQKAVAD